MYVMRQSVMKTETTFAFSLLHALRIASQLKEEK